MASCPIKSSPEWRALVNAVGENKAYRLYAENDFDIPKISGKSVNQSYSPGKKSFKQATTIDKLSEFPEIAEKIITKLNELFPQVRVFKDKILTEDGKYRMIDATKGDEGIHYRNAFIGAVAWSNDSMLETPPHEYAHDYIEMFQDVPMVRDLIEKYGVEGLAIKLGKDFVNRTLSAQQDSAMQRVWNYIKSVFGQKDVFDMLAKNFYKGDVLSQDIHQGNAIFNNHTRKKLLKRNVGAVDTEGEFDSISIPLHIISPQVSKDLIFKLMSGKNVFPELLTEEGSDEFENLFIGVPSGKVNFDRAALVWKDMIKAIRSIDTNKDGKYSNMAGLSSKRLNNLDRNLSKQDYAKELFELFDKKEMPPISERNDNELIDDYYTIINIAQKLNHLNKSKNSIIADGDKFISSDVIFDVVNEQINRTQGKRELALRKIKNKYLRETARFIFKKINDWYITPFMQAKFLAGENSFLMKMYYDGLVDADSKKLDYLRKFNNFRTISEDVRKKLGKFSTQLYKGLNISEYDGKEFNLNVNGQPSIVKLTTGEILSLYLTAQQREKTNLNADENTPRSAILNAGFHLESIEGRNDLQNTLFTLSPKSLTEIEEHVHKNKELMSIVENSRNALDYLYEPVAKTFKQQNGFILPSYESYYPVKTQIGSYNIRTSKNDIENFGSVKERLGTKKPLFIADVNKTLSYHSQVATSYAALAIPIQNNRKILKKLKKEYAGAGTLYAEINQLVNQMDEKLGQLNDPSQLFNTVGEKQWEKTINKITSNFSVSVLAWNIPVMMKQPISYLAAKEEIDYQFLKEAGWGKLGITGISYKEIFKSLEYSAVNKGKSILPLEWKLDKTNSLYKTIVENSPALAQRFEGAVDRELGEAMFDKEFGNDEVTIPFLNKKDGSKYKISKSRLMEGIKIFDAATVMTIWKAASLETQKLHPGLNVESEEFLTHVAKRTEHIVNMTQPSFDLMNRTNLSSFSNPVARTITMFGSARSKLGALMIDGFMDYVSNPTKENKWKLATRSLNVMILTSLAMATINAIKHLGIPDEWKDEDEEVTLGKFSKWTSLELTNNAFASFYGASEIIRSLTSRMDDSPWTSDLEHPVEGLFNDSMSGVFDVLRVAKTDKRTGESELTVDDGLWKLIKAGTKIVGLPSKVTGISEDIYEKVVE